MKPGLELTGIVQGSQQQEPPSGARIAIWQPWPFRACSTLAVNLQDRHLR
jgi:hypothetical protein